MKQVAGLVEAHQALSTLRYVCELVYVKRVIKEYRWKVAGTNIHADGSCNS